MRMLTVFIITLLFASVCYASPNIVGHSDDEITGTGFGTKSPAAPLIWDNFNSGADGGLLANNGWTKMAAASDGGYLEETNAYGGSGLSAYNIMEAPHSTGSSFNTSYRDFSETGVLFATWMQRINYSGVSETGALKYTRFNGNSDDENPYYGGDLNLNTGDAISDAWLRTYFTYGGGDGEYHRITITDSHLPKEQWKRFDIYSVLSTPGEEDGAYFVNYDNVNYANETNVMTRTAGNTLQFKYVALGLMCGSPTFDVLEMWVDNIYVDSTQARVEVGNNATFANCTHREIQIPTAWSDTSITVTWNQGSFENNATAYLFVIDADGVASAGLEGTFVDGTFYSDAVPPASGGNITWGSGSEAITITYGAGAEDITIQ